MTRGVTNPTNPPSPVVTRWGSWFKAVNWHSTHWKHTVDFIRVEAQTDSTLQMNRVLAICDNQVDQELLFHSLSFVENYCFRIADLIVFFQDTKNSLSCEVYDKLNVFSEWLSVEMSCFEERQDSFSYDIFVAIKSKFNDYFAEGKQPSMKFFKVVRFLDPYQFKFFDLDHTLAESVFPELGENEYKLELALYKQLAQNLTRPPQVKREDILSFWKFNKTQLPKLHSIADWALFIPSNSAEAERCISKYNDIVDPKRSNMLPDNLAKLNVIYFNNNNYHSEAFDEDEIDLDEIEEEDVYEVYEELNFD